MSEYTEKHMESEFEEIFIVYFEKIKLFTLKLLKSEAEAEDITQEIFLKLWQQKGELHNIKNLNAYLYRLTRNSIYNHIKNLYVQRKYFETLDNTNVDDGYKVIYERELSERINATIDNFPVQRRNVFLMSRQEGLTNKEIADKLQISKRTVDNHIYIALSELKKTFLTFFILYFNFV